MQKIKITTILLLIPGFYLLIASASAQATPQFLVSWRATDYVPSDYQGKVFPAKGSAIEIGFDLIDKNKIADLSKNEISWSLDNNNLASGTGLKAITFNAARSGNNTHIIRISILNYKGETLEDIVTIPVINPEIVFEIKNPNKQLSMGANSLRALPYFFNVSSIENLSFDWSRDNQLIKGEINNPDFLNLDIESEGQPIETSINITLTIKNLINQLELAIKNINLIVK